MLKIVGVEHEIRSHAHSRDHRKAQRVSAEFRDDIQRIDTVAEGLRHLDVVHVAHRPMEIHGVKRRCIHERVARHDHARDPEKQNLGRGDEVVRRIERS